VKRSRREAADFECAKFKMGRALSLWVPVWAGMPQVSIF
jgi:hypothetical protein